MNELQPLCPAAPRLAPAAALPRYRFIPGLYPHPRRSPEGSLYGQPEHPPGCPATQWQRDASYLFGIDLYHQGYLWESHEAFEACYFATRAPLHRQLLQALIQLAAAELQLHRGIGSGVRTLAARVVVHLESVARGIAPNVRLAGLCPGELAADVRSRFAGAMDGDDPLRTARPPVGLVVSST